MERIVLVHGSVMGGRGTWAAQRPLAEGFELLVLDRPGFPPNPPVDRVDFESDAALVAGLLEPRDHLVGHSYGGIVSLLAAASRPDALRSLTVIEPPSTRVAAGVPAVDAFARAGMELYASAQTVEPDVYLRRFLAAVGSEYDPPSPLPPELEQGARTLAVERGPWEADIPLDALRALGIPTLVVSGAHHAAFDAICDVLERELDAERLVVRGHGHNPQLSPAFTHALLDFVGRAAAARRSVSGFESDANGPPPTRRA